MKDGIKGYVILKHDRTLLIPRIGTNTRAVEHIFKDAVDQGLVPDVARLNDIEVSIDEGRVHFGYTNEMGENEVDFLILETLEVSI